MSADTKSVAALFAANKIRSFFRGLGFSTRPYSGRGMNGRQCLGVELDDTADLGGFISEVLRGVVEKDAVPFAVELAEVFEEMRTDRMGLGVIVYFPAVPFVGPEEEEDNLSDREDEEAYS